MGICVHIARSLPISPTFTSVTDGDVGWEGSSGTPCGRMSSWDEDQNLALACVRFGMSAKLQVPVREERWTSEERAGLGIIFFPRKLTLY